MTNFHVSCLRLACRQTPNRNLLRGAFGASLKRISEEAYERYFKAAMSDGPSGFRDTPRPFVFRLSDPGCVQLNCFICDNNIHDLFLQAMRGITALKPFTEQPWAEIAIPLLAQPATRVRVTFLSPTEFKDVGEPVPGVLLPRLRDRVSNLRALWQDGPLDIDFKAFGERANRIRMTRCELTHVQDERVSKSTGQRHSLSGFTGFAEYEGDLSEFIPYLEIGRYTGVGRQTVWGKGEIAYERTD
jgi:CRISPR-associated endoribonuclease Cas6